MRNRNRGWVLLVVPACLVIGAISAGCSHPDTATPEETAVAYEFAGGGMSPRLDQLEDLMAEVAIKRVWSGHYLQGARLRGAWAFETDLLVEAFHPERGEYELHSIDLATGVPRWVVVLGEAGLRFPPGAGDRFVVCLLDEGMGMVVIDRRVGSRQFRMRAPLSILPAGSPASSDSTVYVNSLVDNRLHALSPDTGQRAWGYRAQGTMVAGPKMTPRVVRQLVVVGTDAGEVIALPAAGWDQVPPSGPAWSRRLLGAVGGEFAMSEILTGEIHQVSAIVPCEDGGLYCLDAATGESRWVRRSDGPFRSLPTVAGGRVYARSLHRMEVMDLRTGELSWPTTEGKGLEGLADYEFALRVYTGDDRRAYLDMGDRRVVRADGRTGKRLASADLSVFDHVLATGNANLLLGLTEDGHMVAFQ